MVALLSLCLSREVREEETDGELGVQSSNFEKGSVESTHKVPTSHYHTKHCHAAVVSLGGLTHR